MPLNALKETIQYIRKPRFIEKNEEEASSKLVFMLKLLAADILIMFMLLGLIGILMDQGLLKEDDSKFKDLMEQYPKYLIFILAVVVAPAFEEFIFRGILRFPEPMRFEFNGFDARDFYKSIFPFLFWIIAIVFAIVHIQNYHMNDNIMMIAPILVLPQLIMGLMLGYIRMRNGFFYGVLFHALHNAFFMGIALLSMENGAI